MEENPLIRAMPGLRVERVRREGGEVMRQHHFHHFHEVYYLLDGARSYFVDGRVYRVRAGGAVFVAADQIHKTTGEGGHERILLEIDQELAQAVCQRAPDAALAPLLCTPALVVHFEGERRGRVERLLTDLLAELSEKRAGYGEMARIRLTELFIGLMRSRAEWSQPIPPEEGEAYRQVYEVVKYIAAHYAELSGLQELGERFYISKYHLCRTFRRITGMTVQEYVTLTRIRAAQGLLLCGGNVTGTAQAVGYDSVTHFERMFRARLGMSPTQYRRRYGQGE